MKLQKSSEFSEETPVNLHGTLIAQEILHFNKPMKVVNSILASDSEKLCQILSDPRGCHITDAFMTSSTIGEKSHESLIKILQQNFIGRSMETTRRILPIQKKRRFQRIAERRKISKNVDFSLFSRQEKVKDQVEVQITHWRFQSNTRFSVLVLRIVQSWYVISAN